MKDHLNLPIGMHLNVPANMYHADLLSERITLSRSCADTLINRSALHAKSEHPRLNPDVAPRDSTSEMDFGDVAHELMLGNGRGFAVWEGKTWQGKDAGIFWDKAVADGVTPIKRADYSRALLAVSEWRRQLQEMGLGYVFSQSGVSEATFLWEESDGCTCRARLDWHIADGDACEIWDLKTTENAHPKTVSKQVCNMNYDLQEVWNTRAYWNTFQKSAGRVKFRFLFAETKPPFAILAYETDGAAKACGESAVMKAVDKWKQCMSSGIWPAYSTELYRGETPAWRLAIA